MQSYSSRVPKRKHMQLEMNIIIKKTCRAAAVTFPSDFIIFWQLLDKKAFLLKLCKLI